MTYCGRHLYVFMSNRALVETRRTSCTSEQQGGLLVLSLGSTCACMCALRAEDLSLLDGSATPPCSKPSPRRSSASKARTLFEAAIEANLSHAESLGNLAVLLHGQACTSPAMLDKIEGLYKRAVHADPANANNLSNFGLFLAEVNGSCPLRC